MIPNSATIANKKLNSGKNAANEIANRDGKILCGRDIDRAFDIQNLTLFILF